MIRIHAHIIEFKIKRICAYGQVLQLVLVQVRPAPQSSIDNMREALASCHLQATVERARYSDALGVDGALLLHGGKQCVHFVRLVLELLGQRLDGPFGELLVVGRLEVTHEGVDNRRPCLVGCECRIGAVGTGRLHPRCSRRFRLRRVVVIVVGHRSGVAITASYDCEIAVGVAEGLRAGVGQLHAVGLLRNAVEDVVYSLLVVDGKSVMAHSGRHVAVMLHLLTLLLLLLLLHDVVVGLAGGDQGSDCSSA